MRGLVLAAAVFVSASLLAACGIFGGASSSVGRGTLQLKTPLESPGPGPSSGPGSWTTKASMPTARSAPAIAVVGGILYAIGGNVAGGVMDGTVEAYDPVTNSWTAKAPKIADSGLAAGVIDGMVYAVGYQAVEVYNPSTDTWTPKQSLPTPRGGLAVGVVNGIIYAIGGNEFSHNAWVAVNTVEAYDPLTNTWAAKAPMPTARGGLGAAVIDGIIYAVGGDTLVTAKTLEAYDPVTNAWIEKAPMPTARCCLAVGAVNGKLYAIGGAIETTLGSTIVEAYDPSTNKWSTKAPMPTKRRDLAGGVVGGVVYAVGGYYDNTASVFDTVEAYTP